MQIAIHIMLGETHPCPLLLREEALVGCQIADSIF